MLFPLALAVPFEVFDPPFFGILLGCGLCTNEQRYFQPGLGQQPS